MLKLIVRSLCLLVASLTVACGGDHTGSQNMPAGLCGTAACPATGGMATAGGGVTGSSGGGMGMGNGGLLGGGGVVGGGGLGSGGRLMGSGGGVPSNGGMVVGGAGMMNAGGMVVGRGGEMNAGGMMASGGMMNTAGMAGSGGMAMVGPYPAGPYGSNVGQTLINLQLSGYLNEDGTGISNDAAKMNWKDLYTLQDLRATGAKYALIHVSQFF